MVNDTGGIIPYYDEIVSVVPEEQRVVINLLVYTILIVVYAVFIWKFYKFSARRNLLELNLNQFNKTAHPGWNKFLASLLYILEYVIIIPLIVIFWFAVLSMFLLVLSKNQSVQQILLIAAAMIAAIRISSYIGGDLAKDLAKMFPFTVLAIFLLDPSFFSFPRLVERFNEIPSMLTHIIIFLVFISALEVIMRFLYLIVQLFKSSEERDAEEVVAKGGVGGK
ncbi:MAG: hypothetical protein KKF56_02900 [Nanoarchaeota archaeon]|nr:hypothetical protein [Nanoarchaeota archaeon]